MLRSYDDILEAAGKPPLWWDEHGVPRFWPFDAHGMDVYAKFIVLARIKCQDCQKEFLVGDCVSMIDLDAVSADLTFEQWVKNYHYGDPPSHREPSGEYMCTGNTMNCIDLEIIEAWRAPNWSQTDPIEWDWIRVPELEGPIERKF